MGQTLYLSDLDGTLLDQDGNLSAYTVQTVRELIAGGGLFTIATARSQQGAQEIMDTLGLALPAVLNNGAAIYSRERAEYLQVNTIAPAALQALLAVLESHGVCGFLYTLQDNLLTVYYRQIHHRWETDYCSTRKERYGGRFYQADDPHAAAADVAPMYVVVYGPQKQLQAVHRSLQPLGNITCEMYSDVYNEYYFLDIFSSGASKASGMQELQRLTGATRTVAFGDNYNDLPMLRAADRAYVPQNAVQQAKDLATGVLDYAHRDGVARFLAKEHGMGQFTPQRVGVE